MGQLMRISVTIDALQRQLTRQESQKSTHLVEICKCSFIFIWSKLVGDKQMRGVIMMGKMSGVVLWANKNDGKAVIWCEDQGDLAYFTSGNLADLHSGWPLDAGDLVSFDLEETSNIRLAHRPELLNSGHAPELARNLPNAQTASERHPQVERTLNSNVIPFPKFASADLCIA